jgi:oligoribonuclease
MSLSEDNLVWVDLEMTGLDPHTDKIIEIASIVTDKDLNILAEGPVIAIHQSDEDLAKMDEWNTNTHSNSGLLERVKNSTYSERDAELETIEFLKQWVPARKSPMCGNSICQDRRFMYESMRELEAYFHYRNIDTSTIKELVIKWRPEILDGYKKKAVHLALDDIRESIEETALYKAKLFLK